MTIVKICHCKSCVEHGAADISAMFGKALINNGIPNAAFVIPDIKTTACEQNGVTVNAGAAKYASVSVTDFEKFFKDKMLPQL